MIVLINIRQQRASALRLLLYIPIYRELIKFIICIRVAHINCALFLHEIQTSDAVINYRLKASLGKHHSELTIVLRRNKIYISKFITLLYYNLLIPELLRIITN